MSLIDKICPHFINEVAECAPPRNVTLWLYQRFLSSNILDDIFMNHFLIADDHFHRPLNTSTKLKNFIMGHKSQENNKDSAQILRFKQLAISSSPIVSQIRLQTKFPSKQYNWLFFQPIKIQIINIHQLSNQKFHQK